MSGSTLTLTQTQITAINDTLNALDAYIKTLQSTQRTAALKGDTNTVTKLHYDFLDANSMEEKLNGMLTMSTIDSLKAAISQVSQATTTLNNQKTQIDTVVKAVDTTATVLNTIASIATAVTGLIAAF